MITVYRIENPDGSGPYRGTNFILKDFAVEISRLKGDDTHPNPMSDMRDLIEKIVDNRNKDNPRFNIYDASEILLKGRKCAFQSIEKMRSWFNDDELSCMDAFGAVLVEYQLQSERDIHFGECQILFRYKNKKKKKYNICEYFNIPERKWYEANEYKARQFEQTFE